MDEMTLRPSELIGIREAMRTMPKLIAALESGEAEKYVLVKRGTDVKGVMLSVETYSEMVAKAKENDAARYTFGPSVDGPGHTAGKVG